MKFIYLLLALSLSTIVVGQEICQNGIDDDGDGQVDMLDSDCYCYSTNSAPASLILNPSFEEMSADPTQMGQIEFATGWKQATAGTPDYFNQNYNWSSADSAELIAADGHSYVGALYTPGWKEYIGTCLSEPLTAGVQYQMIMDVAMFTVDGDGNYCGSKKASDFTPVDITIYGNKYCSNFQTNNLGCPTGNDTETSTTGGDASWIIIGYATYTPSSDWNKVVFNFKPSIDVSSIMIGAPCTLPASYASSECNAYMVYDQLILNSYASFFGKVEAPLVEATKTTDCEGSHYTVSVEKIEGATQFWIAPDETVSEGTEFYLSSVEANASYGSYYILGNCTSEVTKINPFSDAKLLSSEEEIVLPNIITPNGDGINDVVSAEDIINTCLPYEFSIFDRWGGMVYKQTNGGAAFSGKNMFGAEVNDGVYYYTIKYSDSNLKGNLTVVR